MNDYTSRKLIDDSNLPINIEMSKLDIKEKIKDQDK
jgi:hypothetical protein